MLHRCELLLNRIHQEIIWLNSSLDCSEDDFAQALSDLLLQDARLEVRLPESASPRVCRWYPLVNVQKAIENGHL